MPKPRRIPLPLETSILVPHAPLHALDVVRENQPPAWTRGANGLSMQQACGHSVEHEDGDGRCRLCALAEVGYAAAAAQVSGHMPPAFSILPPRVQAGWVAAAAAIRQRVLEERHDA